ncbi:MAG: hypothetical protein WC819_04975 [Parcubacteria group bacterium]|jgi:hypothetical protein
MTILKKSYLKNKDEDLIHLRAIKFGMNFPNGFMYEHFKKRYETHRVNDWKIVDEFLQEAYNNKNGTSNRITPFVLLERGPNGNADTSKYILSYEAYFNYLAYRNAKRTIWIGVGAIIVSVVLSLLTFIDNTYEDNNNKKDERYHYQNIFRGSQNCK